MKRFLVLLVVLLPLSWFAVGCGGGGGGSSPNVSKGGEPPQNAEAMRKAQQEMMKQGKQKR